MDKLDLIREKIRFPGDSAVDDSGVVFDQTTKVRHFLHSDLLVSAELVPEVALSVGNVESRLGIQSKAIQAFIYPSPEYQAECHAIDRGHCVIRLSSTLVEALNSNELEFVIGHELGHFIFQHHLGFLDSSDNLESLLISRKRELSVDRVGLIGAASLNAALSAMIKTASGLSERHLRLNIGAFIGQLNMLDGGSSNGQAVYGSTHPSFAIRCRALLWFSMNQYFGSGRGEFDEQHLTKINERILRELDTYIDGPLNEAINAVRNNYELWLVTAAIVRGKNFAKRQQELFEKQFGSEMLEKIKMYLGNFSAEEASIDIALKLEAAELEFQKLAPRAFRLSIDKSQNLASAYLF